MNTPNTEEFAPLIPRHGIPTSVPDNRKPYQKQLAVFFILASTLFERIAFYSLQSNINLFFPPNATSSSWNPSKSSTTLLLIFLGTTYISTLIFAVISDAKLGRARTIMIGFTLYLIGYGLITTIAVGATPICQFNTSDQSMDIPMNELSCASWTQGSVIFTAIGAGAIKSNLVVFGAEQNQRSRTTSRYFDMYVVAVNIGSMIAALATPLIQEKFNHRYFVPFTVGASMLVAATVMFLLGYRCYLHVTPRETVVSNYIPVFINAFQSRVRYNRTNRTIDAENTDPAPSTLLNASESQTDEENSNRVHQRPSTLLDYARLPIGRFHDRIVDDVKSLRGAFIVFGLLVPYWIVYDQHDAVFRSQAEKMNPHNSTNIVSWLSLADPVTIIIGIVVLNLFVYKCLDVRHRSLTITTKFVVGMCFAFVTMIIAGTIEAVRQHRCNEHHGRNGSDLSIYILLPQNFGLGFSQLFAMVASYEYAYLGAPFSAQSLFMSLHFCSAGIAQFIGVVYMAIFSDHLKALDFSCPSQNRKAYFWFPYGHFFIVGCLQLIFILIFIVLQRKFGIVKLNPQQTETNRFVRHSSVSSNTGQ